jgi:hypothetical protein
VLIAVPLVALAVLLGGSAAASAAGDSTATTRSSPATGVASEVERAAGVREVLVLAPADAAFPAPTVLDQLDPRVVLRVDAFGFEPDRRGSVRQCVRGVSGRERCGNRFPVLFDENGHARFQYLAGDHFLDPGSVAPTCMRAESSCVVRLSDGTTSVAVHTVFGGSAPEARAMVTPAPDAVDPGDRLRVALSGFRPGTTVRVALCAAPAVSGTRRCGGSGAETRVAIGPDGSGRAGIRLGEPVVGSDGVRCGRHTRCALVVQAGGGAVAFAPVEVSYASGPGASYDRARLALGVVLLLLLLGAVVVLFRTTDWRKPSEAETPEMDAAELVDA